MIEKVIDGDVVITKIVEPERRKVTRSFVPDGVAPTVEMPPGVTYRVQKNGLLLREYSVVRFANSDWMNCHIQLGGGVPKTCSDDVDEDIITCPFRQGGFAERHLHFFGTSKDAAYCQEWSLKRMLEQRFWRSNIEDPNEFILPNLASDRMVHCVHPERLPDDVQPDDLRKFCEMEQARFPEEWGPRFAAAILKTSNRLAKWLGLPGQEYKEQMSYHELYQWLISNPDPDKIALKEFHYPATIALSEFYNLVSKLTEKYLAGEYGAKDIPGLLIKSLWYLCLNHMQREERLLRNDDALTIAVSLDEEQENEDGSKAKMLPEGAVSFVTEVEEATDSLDPMLLFIAKNLDLPATEIHKQLEAKGYDKGYKTVQRRKRKFVEIRDKLLKELYEVELEFQDDIERARRIHPELMGHKHRKKG